MAGSATLVLLVVVMRLTGAGALMVCCFFLHLHLVLDGACGRVGTLGRTGEGLLALGLDGLDDKVGRPHAEEDVRGDGDRQEIKAQPPPVVPRVTPRPGGQRRGGAGQRGGISKVAHGGMKAGKRFPQRVHPSTPAPRHQSGTCYGSVQTGFPRIDPPGAEGVYFSPPLRWTANSPRPFPPCRAAPLS